MRYRSVLAGIGAVVALMLGVIAPATAARPGGATVTPVAQFGSGLGSGSAIGPGGDLFVTDGNAGSILRIDRRTGEVSTHATGLPTQVIGIGGAIDVEFIGGTAYALVTLVGGTIFGDPIGNDVVGIYRLETDGSFSIVADIGAWSIENPPTGGAFTFIDTGVQYSLQAFQGGFVVADGHHNRVLEVSLDGDISEMLTFGNEVPTGLEVSGNNVYVSQTGPTPHLPEDGRVLVSAANSSTVTEVAAGARLAVDVEFGRGRQLYALAQGEWDGAFEGSPALEDTGRLMAVNDDGTMTAVVDAFGDEIVLDRPTSLEFVGNTAYVVSLTGEVVRIDDVGSAPFGRR